MNRAIVISEVEIISVMEQMCLESLDPETFEMWDQVLHVLRETRSALAAAPKPVVPAWQPIETAPRDGTDVLIYTMAGSMYVAGYDDAFSNVWRIRNDEGVSARVVTHWMPLPAAPENSHD